MLKAKGFAAVEIGQHAGLADTSLALAVQADLVRRDQLDTAAQSGSGVSGDPRRSSAELGQLGVDHIVEVSVAAIRQRNAAREPIIKTRP
jgi:creatinine amidohydrolase/Fe(II)-dependent formamide hydrolase-like protein